MIIYIENGDLFESTADALVNPVNCKGVMGKGIALEFKKKFPEIFPSYEEKCKQGKLLPGILIPLKIQSDLFTQKRIILFPTKIHWRGKSKIEWIEQGLIYLKKHYNKWGLNSIAMPQIGCGLGGLPWEQVKNCIEKYFQNEPLLIELYFKNPTPSKKQKK